MFNNKKIAVIIAAAGSGNRMGSGIPKQYMEIQGKSILVRSIEAFSNHAAIDEIYAVVDKGSMDYCHRELNKKNVWGKEVRIICGGAQRQDSVYAALSILSEDMDYVLIHDAARPFVMQDSIQSLIEGTVEYGAAVLAVPVKDTIKSAENEIFTETLDRSILYSIQTPQGFCRKLLIRAYQKAFTENFYGTDDAVLVEKLGEKVYLVKGDYNNIKITTKEDVIVGDAILTARKGQNIRGAEQNKAEAKGEKSGEQELRVGTGYDVHRLVEGRKLILGGIEIPFEKGLLGHSDADVLLHAIMDALLGAAAMGDIGSHFPDGEERYRGISSLLLLKRVSELLKEKGFQIENIDATVIAQQPKISSYREEMTFQAAKALDMEADRINIKATTTEKLGFCGREEGIAAQATVLIKRRNNL